MSYLIDVLICSYNEAELIPALLDSLIGQTLPREQFRVIFVDNNSTDNTKQIVESYQNEVKVEYVLEPRQGKSFALNTGYSLAEAEYVAQIDADCKADPRWLENILTVIAEEKPDLLGGPYYPYYGKDKPHWYKDSYNSHVQGEERFVLEQGHYLDGANMVWRRAVVLQLGGHDLELGINSTSVAGGEDTELIDRARKIIPNFKAVYDPYIIVYHFTKNSFFDLPYLAKRYFVTGSRENKIFSHADSYSNTLKTLLKIIFFSLRGYIKRDKQYYTYYENYLIEIIFPLIYQLGKNYQTQGEER